MWKALLLVAAALGFLWWVGSLQQANAAEEVKSPRMVVNFPLVCMDETILDRMIGLTGSYPVWNGIRNQTFLTTLYLSSGGGWMLTEQRAMSKTTCILSSGEQNELLGIGGI